jgi:hypothetical protein
MDLASIFMGGLFTGILVGLMLSSFIIESPTRQLMKDWKKSAEEGLIQLQQAVAGLRAQKKVIDNLQEQLAVATEEIRRLKEERAP